MDSLFGHLCLDHNHDGTTPAAMQLCVNGINRHKKITSKILPAMCVRLLVGARTNLFFFSFVFVFVFVSVSSVLMSFSHSS